MGGANNEDHAWGLLHARQPSYRHNTRLFFVKMSESFRVFLSAQEHWAKSPVCPSPHRSPPGCLSQTHSVTDEFAVARLSTTSDQLTWQDEFSVAYFSTQSFRLMWRLTLGSVHSKGLTGIIKSWTPVSQPSNSLWSACFPSPSSQKAPIFSLNPWFILNLFFLYGL